MKTNVIMERKIGRFIVNQRTQDGYFNATTLLKQWNGYNKSKKEIKEFLRNDQTKAFIEVLQNEENLNGDNSPYLATRGKSGATWMHPYLFIKFAMWINPRFEYHVIKFVYDQLIEFRHTAGDNYRVLASAITKFNGVNYARVAKGLNYIIFGAHESNLRQTATQLQLNQLTALQKQLAFAVDMGYIKSFDHLMSEMIKIWKLRTRTLI